MEAVMAHEDKPDGFLSRWSRRKLDVREGRALDEPHQVVTPKTTPAQVPVAGGSGDTQASDAATHPLPTLADTQGLTPDSDFTGFMARGVSPDVKNAAMKKLFTDPHFNVMDRMDIYIDDYSQPDPLPMAMLRQMASTKTLGLFDDEDQAQTVAPEPSVGDKPDVPEVKVVAQSAPTENNSNIEPHTHDHADLRLQPDPAARPEGSEPNPV
jgi:hypothetical protein